MTDIEKRALKVYPEGWTNDKKREGYIKCAEEYESIPKVRGWVARDEDKTLNVFLDDYCPDRGECVWLGERKIRLERKGTKVFSEITWESEPVEVELLVRRV